MLYEVFDSLKEAHGQDYFTARVSDDILQNLNPKFELREYQKEALGRFDFYFNGYQKRQYPTQLRITADKKEIKDFPKPSPLCVLLESWGVLSGRYGRGFITKIKLQSLEGWASCILHPLYDIPPRLSTKFEIVVFYRIVLTKTGW